MNHSRKKVILVDDIVANLNQGRNMLKVFYEVFPALSAAKLFEFLERFIPDIILLDIEMPEMNGFEAARKIRALELPRAKTIPIIAMTESTYREDIERYLEAGMNGHVRKPLDFDEVLIALRMYLP